MNDGTFEGRQYLAEVEQTDLRTLRAAHSFDPLLEVREQVSVEMALLRDDFADLRTVADQFLTEFQETRIALARAERELQQIIEQEAE